MPGTFLTPKERERLACFPDDIPHWDLITSFTLTDEDHTFIKTYRNDPHRLGVALQLGAVRYLGFCPMQLHAASMGAVSFLAEQLQVDPTVFQDYGMRRMTRSAHFQAVLDHGVFCITPNKVYSTLQERIAYGQDETASL